MQVFNWHQFCHAQTTHNAYSPLHRLPPFLSLSLFLCRLNCLSFGIICAFIKIYHESFYLQSKTSYSRLHLNMYASVCTLHTYMLGCLLLHWLTEFFCFRYVWNSLKHSTKKQTKIINKFVINFSTIFHFRLSLFFSNFRVRINECVWIIFWITLSPELRCLPVNG